MFTHAQAVFEKNELQEQTEKIETEKKRLLVPFNPLKDAFKKELERIGRMK